MQIRKLFQILVAGGAILGGVTSCGGSDGQGQTNSPTTGGGGQVTDGGTDPGGGGMPGWG
jgi:hypothetical protein